MGSPHWSGYRAPLFAVWFYIYTPFQHTPFNQAEVRSYFYSSLHHMNINSRGKGLCDTSLLHWSKLLLTTPALHTHRHKHTNQPFIQPTTASQPKSPLPNSGVISKEPGGQARQTPTSCWCNGHFRWTTNRPFLFVFLVLLLLQVMIWYCTSGSLYVSSHNFFKNNRILIKQRSKCSESWALLGGLLMGQHGNQYQNICFFYFV